MEHDDYVNDVAFSPDGEYVVSASDDGTVLVWEATSGREVARMGHDGSVFTVAFSPDGQYVASASYDGTARIWLWQLDLVGLACSLLERNLDQATWEQYLGDEPYRKTCPELP